VICRRDLTERACPHCGDVHDGRLSFMCADTHRWTQQERDELRASLRRRYPSITFAPSTAVMQDRFGARNRADAERTAR
jgi:hypothetical protein